MNFPVPIESATLNRIPVRPAARNWKRKAMQKSIGVLNSIFPPHMVASQLKILIQSDGDGLVDNHEKVFALALMPTVNM